MQLESGEGGATATDLAAPVGALVQRKRKFVDALVALILTQVALVVGGCVTRPISANVDARFVPLTSRVL